MGLGVVYRADLPQRALSDSTIAVDELWDEVSEVVARLASELGNPIEDWFWHHASGDRMWICVVPFEENIELFVEAGAVVFSAKTSGAGPGYHEFLVAILDELEVELGLAWSFGEDEGDETGFRESREVGELRRAMAAQVRGLARIVIERVGQGALVNMGLDFRPTVRAFAASPLGEWSAEWFESLAAASDEDVLAMAEDFFPWWNRELSGDEFAKFGMVVCWNDVRWVSPVGDAEELAIGTALDCFEQARALGTRLEIPELVRAELKRLTSPEAPTHPPGPEGIGYRRRTVTVSLPGEWELDVPGYFHDAVEDDGGTLVYWLEQRTIRASTMSFEDERPAGERLELLLEGNGEQLADLSEGIVGALEVTTDPDDEGFIAQLTLVTSNALCSLTFAYTEIGDRDWAIRTARTARCRSR